MKKILSLMLALVLTLSTFMVQTTPAEAANLNKPINVKVVLTAKNASKVTWKKVNKAKTYEVYYSVNGNKYKKLKTTKYTYVKQTKLTAGKTYSYKVRAINGKTKSSYSTVKSIKTISSASPNLKATAYTKVSDANKVLLKWSKVKNAKGYYVYKNSGNWYKLVKKTTSLLYKDPTGQLATKYTYKVVPYIVSNGKTFKGTASIKSVKTRNSGYLMKENPPYYSDETLVTDTFQMGGVMYSNGFACYMRDYEYHEGSTVLFNLGGKYSTLSFVSGMLDNSYDRYDTTIDIYSDGDKIYSYKITSTDLPRLHTINVKDCSQLKIIGTGPKWEAPSCGFGDMIITK